LHRSAKRKTMWFENLVHGVAHGDGVGSQNT